MGLMLLGGLIVAGLFALVTDAIVTARIARTLGELPRPRSDNAVVCGLGRVGFRIVQRLVAAGVPVRRRRAQRGQPVPRRNPPAGRARARRRREPARDPRALRIPKARVVLAVTDDDLANLETALNARALNPSLRVVMRLFSHDRAERDDRTLSIAISRSVSALAARSSPRSCAGGSWRRCRWARARSPWPTCRGRPSRAAPSTRPKPTSSCACSPATMRGGCPGRHGSSRARACSCWVFGGAQLGRGGVPAARTAATKGRARRIVAARGAQRQRCSTLGVIVPTNVEHPARTGPGPARH
jgi:TrkA-N domain